MALNFDLPISAPKLERERQLPMKALIGQIIQRRASEDITKQAHLAQLEGMTEGEIKSAINEAINYVSVNGRFEQFHVGGNFINPDGKSNRGRRIVGLDEPALTERYPFLRYICLKVVPPETRLHEELETQRQIQERLAAEPYNGLRIPLLLGEVQRPDLQLKGALMERLPRNTRNGSLQVLASEGREAKVSLRLSNNVEGEIASAFQAFHAIGFEHRDTNDGNVYLTNIVYEEVAVPKEPGKVRPSRLRLITKADVYLLDFERTHPLPAKQPDTTRVLVEQENGNVSAMLDPYVLEIDSTEDKRDLVEAVDAYYTRRQGKITSQGRSLTS